LALKPFFAFGGLLNFFRTHAAKLGQSRAILVGPQSRSFLAMFFSISLHIFVLTLISPEILPCADNKLQKSIKAKITKRGTFIV
jgi:hypothetical protein